jgi:anti-sigma-K factor RskA
VINDTEPGMGKHNREDMVTSETQNDPLDPAYNSAAYALGALSGEEKKEFERHLAESESTRNEVTELSETAALLGLSVTPVTPSPALKTNLMAMLASTPQLPRETASERPAGDIARGNIAQGNAAQGDVADSGLSAPTPLRAVAPVAPVAEVTDAEVPVVAPVAPVASGAERRAKARWFNRPALAISSVAAAIALIVGGGVVTNQLSDATYQRQQADQLAQINSADDMQQAAAAVATGGTATLVWSAELGKSAVIVDGLEELPSDKTYELWYIAADGTITAAGLMDVAEADNTWRVLDGEMEAGDTVGVTIEPKGGSEQPTTDPIVAISGEA